MEQCNCINSSSQPLFGFVAISRFGFHGNRGNREAGNVEMVTNLAANSCTVFQPIIATVNQHNNEQPFLWEYTVEVLVQKEHGRPQQGRIYEMHLTLRHVGNHKFISYFRGYHTKGNKVESRLVSINSCFVCYDHLQSQYQSYRNDRKYCTGTSHC